jgi:hypothetical protein
LPACEAHAEALCVTASAAAVAEAAFKKSLRERRIIVNSLQMTILIGGMIACSPFLKRLSSACSCL